ncbi:ankyrin repeat domain-containing protein [Mariniblastus fucicola]|uniref:ankyrin repeat domain-containing protein n=1 Tax=Mariniblastus fucicola TaxID=980251 RepID=UPI0011DF4468|nr:ankyrin repeat domain-containing protein [Mariniblastus fucicola]
MSTRSLHLTLLILILFVSELRAQTWHPFEGSPQEFLQKGQPEEALRIMMSNPKWISLGDSRGRTPLHYAAKLNLPDVAKWLLENGADVNAAAKKNTSLTYSGTRSRVQEILKRPYGETALMFARTREMAKLLLDRGADINAVNELGETPLFLTQSPEVAKYLIANVSDLELKDNFGQTALQSVTKSIENGRFRVDEEDRKAYWRRRSEIAFELIKAGAECDIESAICLGDLVQVKRKYRPGPNNEYSFALKTAVRVGQVEIFKYLLAEESIDFNKPKLGYDSLFHHALKHPAIVKLFIENGADVNATLGLSGGMSGMHIIGLKALVIHHAVNVSAPPASIKLILDAGADPFDQCESINGLRDGESDLVTPIDVAFWHSAFGDNSEIVLALIGHEKFQIDEKGQRQELFDRYLFQCFGMEKSTDLVKIMIDKGANPKARFNGFSALQANWLSYELIGGKRVAATNQSCFDVANLLIEKGLKQDLETSVMFGDLQAVERLLAQGERLKDDCHYNAIGICIKERRPEMLQCLLESGVKIEEGPLAWAAAMGQRQIVEMLLQHGADVNEHDRFFGTPLHRAVRVGHTDIVKLLLENGADPEVKDGKGKTALQVCDDPKRRVEIQTIFETYANESKD